MRVFKWAGGIFLVLLIALVLFVAFGLDTLKGPIARAVTNGTGRELTIDGHLKAVWSWVYPRFRVEGVSFANPQWASEHLMFKADAVEASVELAPLFIGRVVLPEVHLTRPVVNLEIDDTGRKNWLLDQQQQKEGGSRIAIHALTLDRGELHYRDAERDINLDVGLDTDAQGVAFQVKGIYKDLPAAARGGGGRVLRLKDPSMPYPTDATAKIGGTELKANGTVTHVAQLSALDLAIEVRGKTMSELYDVIGIAFPETTPYTTRGRLVKGDHMIRYENFTGKVGESDLAGTLQFDLGGKRAFMHGDLQSKLLDLADLGPLVGTDQPRESGVLPDMPFDSDRWDSIDADVRIKAASIKRPKQLPLEHLASRIQMRDKVLTLEPFEFGIAGGRIAGTIKLDGQKQPIAATTNLRVKDLSLPEFFPTLKDESLDRTLNPHPKDRSIASLNSPLYIRGTFGAPKFAPDWKRLGTKSVGVLAMGIINPLLAVLPLIQEGKEKESPCAALIAEATKSAKQSAQEAEAGVPRPPAVGEKPRESAAAGGTRREQDSVPASPPQ